MGPGVTRVAPATTSCSASCPPAGTARRADGHSNLCDNGAALLVGAQLDGTTRHHSADGTDLWTMVCLGTFGEHTVVNEMSCVKIDDDIPLELACLVGCGVTTGWGSSVCAAEVGPGENVAVIGVGGIGMAAVQGARLAGARQIVAVDPVEFKREQARRWGHPHRLQHRRGVRADPGDHLGSDVRQGHLAMGVGEGQQIAPIMTLCAKRGRVVVTTSTPPRRRASTSRCAT